MALFKDKYRIESNRLAKWDYSSSGYYFVTICTQNRVCYFGNITDNTMLLSEIGNIITQHWQNTVIIRPNVQLDEYVIMPNHIHGIIVIDNDSNINVEAHSYAPLQSGRASLQNKRNNLSNIIRGFKSASTNNIRSSGYDFRWQRNYYEHIIRNEKELNRIRDYIINNPANWKDDENYA